MKCFHVLKNLYTDPRNYIVSATTENVNGTSQSYATYIYGTTLGHVANPKTMLKLTPGTKSIQVEFIPPCPYVGDLTYQLNAKANMKSLNYKAQTCLILPNILFQHQDGEVEDYERGPFYYKR